MKRCRFCLFVVVVTACVMMTGNTVRPLSAAEPLPITALSCFTWGSGTQSYFVVAAMSEVVGKYTPIRITPEPTAGVPAWLPMLVRREGDMGTASSIEAYDAYYGVGTWKGRPHPMRLLFSTYASQHLIYARPDRGIKSIPDLRGKKVSIYQPAGTIMHIVGPLALEAHGLKPDKDYVALVHSTGQEKKEALIDGRIDAFYYTFPVSDALEVKRAVGLISIPIPEKGVKYVKEKTGYPVFSGEIKPSLIKEYNIAEGATTISYSICFIGREDLQEEVVYHMLKALFGHFDEFARMHVRAAETTLENAVFSPGIPFHSGAIKYYKERGVWSPELEKTQKELMAKPRGK